MEVRMEAVGTMLRYKPWDNWLKSAEVGVLSVDREFPIMLRSMEYPFV